MKRQEINEIKVLDYLNLHNKMTVQEAMAVTDLSESTVRRLFTRLENSGKCLRYYGGIRLLLDDFSEPNYYSYESEEYQYTESKLQIARTAVSLVESGDVLFVDSGTTLSRFAAALSDRIGRDNLENLTVYTNSLVNLNMLRNVDSVNLIGGAFRKNRKDFCGYLAEESLMLFHFTKCFLGADGFSAQSGFTTTDCQTARLNEIALQNSEKKYILMDSSKFFYSSVVAYSRNAHVDAIITDSCPEELDLSVFEARNIKIIAAAY